MEKGDQLSSKGEKGLRSKLVAGKRRGRKNSGLSHGLEKVEEFRGKDGSLLETTPIDNRT